MRIEIVKVYRSTLARCRRYISDCHLQRVNPLDTTLVRLIANDGRDETCLRRMQGKIGFASRIWIDIDDRRLKPVHSPMTSGKADRIRKPPQPQHGPDTNQRADRQRRERERPPQVGDEPWHQMDRD